MASTVDDRLPSYWDVDGAYEWLKRNSFLKRHRKCGKCGLPLELDISIWNCPFDAWMCQNEKCPKYEHEILIVEGSFFSFCRSRSKVPRLINLIQHWCAKKTLREASENLYICQATAFSGYKLCKNFCTLFFQRYPIELGGKDVVVVVKVYEKRYNFSVTKFSLLMMADTSRDPLVGYVQVLNFEEINTSTILSIIRSTVKPDSIIAYDGLKRPPRVKGMKLTFINCTDKEEKIITAYHDSHLKIIRKITNANPVHPEYYLNESMWRERYQNDAFKNFIYHLRLYYNPEACDERINA